MNNLKTILEEHRNTVLIADLIDGPKTRIKAFEKSDDQAEAKILALLPKKRSGGDNEWIFTKDEEIGYNQALSDMRASLTGEPIIKH